MNKNVRIKMCDCVSIPTTILFHLLTNNSFEFYSHILSVAGFIGWFIAGFIGCFILPTSGITEELLFFNLHNSVVIYTW